MSLPIINLLGVYLGELGGKTPTAGVPGRGLRRLSSKEFDGILQLRPPCDQRSTTFVFGSWICTANGSGGFDRHLATTMSTEAPQQEQLDGIISAKFLLPELTDEVEKLSLSDTSSTRLAPLGVDSIYSKSPHHQLSLGLQNVTASYLTTMRRRCSQRIVNEEVTAHREAPIFDSYPDSDDELDPELIDHPSLTIIATPRSHFMYWKGSEPAELLDNMCLIACLRDLPYQAGRPLSPIEEEGVGDIALVDYSTTH